jgi:DUF1009 family protein
MDNEDRTLDSHKAISSPVGLIAGSGNLPFAVADSLVRRGIGVVFFAIKGFCDPDKVTRFPHHWIALGQFGRLTRLMHAQDCRDIVFIGGLVRPALSDLRLDWGTLRALPAYAAALRGGDDHLLSGVSRVFEQNGFRLLGIKDVAPDILMPEGCLTRAMPNSDTVADIAKGRELLQAISSFDVGQAVVVIDGHIIGVEDIEGTDGLLARVARLRASGRVRGKAGRGVLVKAPKSQQDMRFDLPTFGPKTIEGIAAAQLAGVAVVAGHTLLAEPQLAVIVANKAGVFVTGLQA